MHDSKSPICVLANFLSNQWNCDMIFLWVLKALLLEITQVWDNGNYLSRSATDCIQKRKNRHDGPSWGFETWGYGKLMQGFKFQSHKLDGFGLIHGFGLFAVWIVLCHHTTGHCGERVKFSRQGLCTCYITLSWINENLYLYYYRKWLRGHRCLPMFLLLNTRVTFTIAW